MSNLTKTWNNQKVFFLCLGFLLLVFFLFWPSPTLAFWETLKNAIVAIPAAIISAILILFVYLTYGLAWLTGTILDIVISPAFIALKYTDPAGNPIIQAGLSITQSFVNLLLVVALVYTALSIALRINETGAKKMLVRLIIVALLVNFAPVFCGLVVDATNIVMYWFLKPIEGGVSGVLLQMDISTVYSMIKGAGLKAAEQLGVLMAVVTQIILNVSMAIAFLLYAAIFLLRYIAIWVLVILAPLAFVGWVFPKAKPTEHWEFLDWFLLPLRMLRGFWDMWLEQFIQWAIIGIPIAFFLYLAMGSFSIMTAAFQQKITMPGIETQAAGYLGEVFPFFVVIVFLFLGFTIGLQTGAMGAEKIVAGFQAAHKKAQGITLQAAARTARGAFTAPVRGFREARGVVRSYRWGRKEGISRKEIIGGLLGTYARRGGRRLRKAGIETREIGRDLSRAIFGTRRGIIGTVRDVASTGWKAALKAKKKEEKKEEKKVTCPKCRETVPDRDFCGECGAKL